MSVNYHLIPNSDNLEILKHTKYQVLAPTTFTAVSKDVTGWVWKDPDTWASPSTPEFKTYNVKAARVYNTNKYYKTLNDTTATPSMTTEGGWYYGYSDVYAKSRASVLAPLYGTYAVVTFDGVKYGPFDIQSYSLSQNYINMTTMAKFYEDEDLDLQDLATFELVNEAIGIPEFKLIGNPSLIFNLDSLPLDSASERYEEYPYPYVKNDLYNTLPPEDYYNAVRYLGGSDIYESEKNFVCWSDTDSSYKYAGRFKDLPFAFVEFPYPQYPIVADMASQHSSVFGDGRGGYVFCSTAGEHTISIDTYRVHDGDIYKSCGLDEVIGCDRREALVLVASAYNTSSETSVKSETADYYLVSVIGEHITDRTMTIDLPKCSANPSGSTLIYSRLDNNVYGNVYYNSDVLYDIASNYEGLRNNDVVFGTDVMNHMKASRSTEAGINVLLGANIDTSGNPDYGSTLVGSGVNAYSAGDSMYATAMGTNVSVQANDSTAIGSGLKVYGHCALAIGQSVATGDKMMGIGKDQAQSILGLSEAEVTSKIDSGYMGLASMPLANIDSYNGCTTDMPDFYSSPIACQPTVIGNGGVDNGCYFPTSGDMGGIFLSNGGVDPSNADALLDGQYLPSDEAYDQGGYINNRGHKGVSDYAVVDQELSYLVLANGGLAVGSYGSLPYASVLNRWGTAFGKANLSTGVNAWAIGHGNNVSGHGCTALGHGLRTYLRGQFIIGDNTESNMLMGSDTAFWAVDRQEHTLGRYANTCASEPLASKSADLKKVFNHTSITHQWVDWFNFNYGVGTGETVADKACYVTDGIRIPCTAQGSWSDFVSSVCIKNYDVTEYMSNTAVTADNLPTISEMRAMPTTAGWFIKETLAAGTWITGILFNPGFEVASDEYDELHCSGNTFKLLIMGQGPFRITYHGTSTQLAVGSDSAPTYPFIITSQTFDLTNVDPDDVDLDDVVTKNVEAIAVDYLGNVHTPDGALILKSANKKWKLTVNDSGTLSAVEYTEFTNPFGS